MIRLSEYNLILRCCSLCFCFLIPFRAFAERDFSALPDLEPSKILVKWQAHSGWRITGDEHGRIYMGYPRGFAFSDNDGRSWMIKGLKSFITDDTATSVTPSKNGKILWIGSLNGVFRVSDNGRMVADISSLALPKVGDGCVGTQPKVHLDINPFYPGMMIASESCEIRFGVGDGDAYISLDGGAPWRDLDTAFREAGFRTARNGDNSMNIGWHPEDPERFLVASDLGAFETRDSGRSFVSLGDTMPFEGGALYTRNQEGELQVLQVSACSLANVYNFRTGLWSTSSGHKTNCGTNPRIYVDPGDLTKVVIGQAGVRYSIDGGLTFHVPEVESGINLSSWQVFGNIYKPGVFYAYGGVRKVFKSTNSGRNWFRSGDLSIFPPKKVSPVRRLD